MKRNTASFILLVFATIGGTAPAQVTLSVEALGPSGVALVDGAGVVQASGFVPNQPLTVQTIANVQTNGTGSAYFVDWIETELTPPSNVNTLLQNTVAIESKAFARNGTVVPSMFTTGSTPGVAGTQRFRITMTAASPSPVELDVWGQGQNFGNATISLTMIHQGVSYPWSWLPGQGFSSSSLSLPFTVMGTVTVDVEIAGTVSPGPGGGTYYDGYDTRWSFTAQPVTQGTINYYGSGCGPATLSHLGTPTTGSLFTLQVTGAPTSAPIYFMIGTRNDVVPFLGWQLPYDLSALGAPGCTLLVGSPAPWWIVSADPNAPNQISVYLNPWTGGTFYVQGLILDSAANAAGIQVTRAAQITF